MQKTNLKIRLLFLPIIFFGFFGLAESSLAATYYVSTTGNDSNIGTSEGTAQKTIAKVNSSTAF